MSNTYTTRAKLAMPALGDTGWAVPVNGNCATLDALTAVGALAVTLAETPSASLNVSVASGSYLQQDGTVATFAGASSQAITASSTVVLYLDGTASWSLTVAASYPTTPHVRLASVVSGASTITSITDGRQCFSVVGSWADGVNITLGTTTGTQIGTASGQKLSFWGKSPPVVQQTGGAATAGASYTSTEQNMLQVLWDMARTVGLLS